MNSSRLLLATLTLCAGAALGCADAEESSSDAPINAVESEETPAVNLEQSTAGAAQQLNILKVEGFGSGCPEDSYVVRKGIDPDGRAFFDVKFTEYKITADVDHPVNQWLDCKLNVTVEAPKSVAFAVANVIYAGRTVLDSGMKAELQVSAGFHGRPPPMKTFPFSGPIVLEKSDWEKKDSVENPLFSTCGANSDLELNTRLSLTNTSNKKDGEIVFKQLRGDYSMRILFNLRSCPLTPPRAT